MKWLLIFLLFVYNAEAQRLRGIRNLRIGSTNTCNIFSAVFDGGDYLSKAGSLTGVSDGNVFLMSFWVKMDGDDVQEYFMHEDNGNLHITRESDNTIKVVVSGVGGVPRRTIISNDTLHGDGLWHHVLISVDANTAGASWIYLDGNDMGGVTEDSNGSIDLTPSNWGIGGTAAGSTLFSGKLAEFYWTNEWLDISIASNREKFRSASGYPVNLGPTGAVPTGTAAKIYFWKQVTNWDDNQGTGGAFTENGALTDGGIDTPCNQ